MARELYLKQLDLLKESVISFGKITDQIFRDSMVSVTDLNTKLAKKTLALETNVNEFEEEIEVSILDLLALQQPMACDLRLVVSSLKISADLKRIIGLSINIAKIPEKSKVGMLYI